MAHVQSQSQVSPHVICNGQCRNDPGFSSQALWYYTILANDSFVNYNTISHHITDFGFSVQVIFILWSSGFVSSIWSDNHNTNNLNLSNMLCEENFG